MGSYSYFFNSNNGLTIQSDVKYIDYYITGGGGGGARPRNPPNFGRTPTAGGSSSLSTGLFAGGGQPGQINYGGSGGYGNYRYGETGFYAYGPDSRARSGYGPYGTGGAGQWRSPDQSYGGGGGGGSYARYCRNSNGAIPGQYVTWSIGQGGEQGGTGANRYGEAGSIYIYVCSYDRPTNSITVSPSAIIKGNNATLSWSASGDVTSSYINNNIGTVSTSGSLTVSPTSTTTYTYTVLNPAYTVTKSVTLSVYIPPVVSLTVSAPNKTIIQGESTTLSWSTTGDASSMTISPGIGNANLNGSVNITPTVTTTYTATATGLGGTGSAEVTVTVLNPPSLTVTAPVSILYGQQSITFSIEGTNVPGGITYTVTKSYDQFGDPSGNNDIVSSTQSIPNSSGNQINLVYAIPLVWDTRGPRTLLYYFTAVGYGTLRAYASATVQVSIDETPDYIDVPESDNTFKDEEPVITPDALVVTEQITVTDIDIPVEVKSNRPIQIEINNSDNWLNIREL